MKVLLLDEQGCRCTRSVCPGDSVPSRVHQNRRLYFLTSSIPHCSPTPYCFVSAPLTCSLFAKCLMEWRWSPCEPDRPCRPGRIAPNAKRPLIWVAGLQQIKSKPRSKVRRTWSTFYPDTNLQIKRQGLLPEERDSWLSCEARLGIGREKKAWAGSRGRRLPMRLRLSTNHHIRTPWPR